MDMQHNQNKESLSDMIRELAEEYPDCGIILTGSDLFGQGEKVEGEAELAILVAESGQKKVLDKRWHNILVRITYWPSSVFENLLRTNPYSLGLLSRGEILYDPRNLAAYWQEIIKDRYRTHVRRQMLFCVGFLCLATLVWYCAVRAGWALFGPVLTDPQPRLLRFFSGILALVVSWIIVGRKIDLTSNFRETIRYISLGPFVRWEIWGMNTRQLRALWIALVLLLLLLLFPPWVGYNSTIDGKPVGEPLFVGFHWVLMKPSRVGLVGPHITGEINKPLWFAIGLVLVLSCFFIVILQRDREQHKAA